MKRSLHARLPGTTQRETGVADSTTGHLPGFWRVEDCELHFRDGEMAVTFRLSLPDPVSTPRRVPPRPSKSKP